MRYLDNPPVTRTNKKTKKSTTVVPARDVKTEVWLAWNKDGVDADTNVTGDATTWSTSVDTCYVGLGSATADTSCATGSVYPDTVSGTTRTASRETANKICAGSANTLAIIAKHDELMPTAASKALYATGNSDNYSNTPSGGSAVTD